jgi:ABC-2 type transport system permease protein
MSGPLQRWHRYWITYATLLNKEVLRFSRIWVQTVLPSAITTTLYFVIFGQLIGERSATWTASTTSTSSCRAWC